MESCSVSELPALGSDPYEVVVVGSGGDTSKSFTDSLYTEFKKRNLTSVRREVPTSWLRGFPTSVRRGFIREAVAQAKRNNNVAQAKRTNIETELLVAEANLLADAAKLKRTLIAILDDDYARSSQCLDGLVDILESHGQKKTVLPVFYNVNPSDVRNQTGSFEEAFARHEETYKDDPDKVRRWRAALTEVANLAGWDSRGRYVYILLTLFCC